MSNGLSARVAADLRRRGFKYLGPTTVYSHLQACGIINDHGRSCPRYAAVNALGPTVERAPLPREGRPALRVIQKGTVPFLIRTRSLRRSNSELEAFTILIGLEILDAARQKVHAVSAQFETLCVSN